MTRYQNSRLPCPESRLGALTTHLKEVTMQIAILAYLASVGRSALSKEDYLKDMTDLWNSSSDMMIQIHNHLNKLEDGSIRSDGDRVLKSMIATRKPGKSRKFL